MIARSIPGGRKIEQSPDPPPHAADASTVIVAFGEIESAYVDGHGCQSQEDLEEKSAPGRGSKGKCPARGLIALGFYTVFRNGMTSTHAREHAHTHSLARAKTHAHTQISARISPCRQLT